jgi:hypothetical protein
MLPLSKGDGGTPSSVLQGSDSLEKTSEPIGSLAEYQLSTPSFRRIRPQNREEWQVAIECPASPEKRKVDQETYMRIHENALVKSLDTIARTLRASAAPMTAAASLDHAQAIRSEVRDDVREMKVELMQLVNTMMETMQAEADRRADAMLQTVMQMLKNAPATEDNKVAPV